MSLGYWQSLVRRHRPAWLFFFSTFLLVSNLLAVEPPKKAGRYHTALTRRPTPGYLFDRFYNAWLDEDTVEHLESFLVERAEESDASADGLLLAFFYAKQGDELKALEQFRVTLEHDPGSAEAWYEKAVIEARMLNFENALSDLNQATAAEPEQKLAVRIAKLKGQLLVRDRRRGEAIEVWSNLLEEFPADEDLSEDIIELEINEGLFDEAAELSLKLIENTKDPYRKVLRQLRLGDIRHRAGNRDAAVTIYRETLAQVGTDSWIEREILAQIERIFRREDNIAALRKEYERLHEAYPRRVGIRREYANVLAELGESEAAIEEFREILELTPGDRAQQEAFIQLLSRTDRIDDAIKQLETLIEQYPQDAELYVQLSSLQGKAKRPDKAEAAVEKFLTSSDKSEYAYLRAARLLEQLEVEDSAKKMYQRMVEAYPDSVSAQEAHAAFLYKQGDKDKALEIWRSLCASGDADQVIRIARALSSRNEHESAFTVLKQQAEANSSNALFLGQLVAAAMPVSKFDEAIAWARRRVELSATEKELSDAVVQAARVIARGNQLIAIIAELQNNPQRTVQQTCLLAELLEESGDSISADEVLAPLAEKQEPAAIGQQIRLTTVRRDWKAAVDATKRLIDLPDGRKSANVRQLVDFLERDFQFDEALSWIEQWKKLSPGSISPWLTQSRILLLDGKYEAAIETMRQASIEFAGNQDIRSRLAQLYTEAGKLADAERIYWQQYEETESLEGKIRAVAQLAQVAESQGRVEHLVERFEERRRNNRLSIEPLLALAEIHRVADNYEKRRQALTEASKLKPDDLGLLMQVARIEEQEGDWERALSTLQRAAQLDKTNKTQQRIARLHLQYGNTAEGFALLYELAGGDESDPRDIEEVADAIIGVGEWQQAREYLSAQLEHHPEDYRLRYLLALAHEEEFDTQAAIDEFVKLLSVENEIAGLNQNSALSNINSYLDMLRKVMPPESLDLIVQSQNQYQAYSYRQQHGAVISLGASGQTSRVLMPTDTEAAGQFATAHLAAIAQELDEKELEKLRARMEANGVPNADILIALGSSQRNNSNTMNAALEEFADREAALGYLVMMGSQRNGSVEMDLLKNAFKHFEDSYPQLAIMAGLQSLNSAGESTELLDQAVNMMDQIDEPNYILIYQLCNLLGGLNNNQAPTLPDKHRPVLTEKLIQWYPLLRNNQIYSWISLYVIQAVKNSGDVATYINLLEEEVASWRKDGAAKQQVNMFGGGNQSTIALPRFPPAALKDFPPTLLQLLGPNGNRQFGIATAQSSWNSSDLLEALPQVQDPILRTLLAKSIDNDEPEVEKLIETTLAEAVAADTPSLDAYLMAAARATEQHEFDKAIALLDKGRYLPMQRVMRRTVDGNLLALVLEREEKPAEDSELMELARGAALRLRHGTVAPQEREQLVAALEELGLTKEAERLEQKTSVASSSSPLYSPTVTTSTTPDRIKELLDNNKREVAAKLIHRELLGHIGQAVSTPSNMSYMWRQALEVGERIQVYGLVDEVMAESEPGDSTNHRKFASYALVCEALGRLEEARRAYTQAHELRPQEDLYRVKLALLSEDDNPERTAELLANLSPAGDILVASEVSARLDNYQSAFKDRLAAAKFALKYLRARQGNEKADVSWVPRFCQGWGSYLHSNSVSADPLYVPQENANSSSRSVSTDFLKQRRQLHDDICHEMLNWPELAETAFVLLLAAHEAAGEVDEQFLELAQDAILTSSKQRPSAQTTGNYFSFGQGIPSNHVPMRTAEEHLARHCSETDDWTIFDKKLLPEIQSGTNRDLRLRIESIRELYTCSAEDFIEISQRAVKRTSTRAVPYQSMSESELAVIEAWSYRKLNVDLRDTVFEFVKQNKRNGNSFNPPHYLYTFLERLSEVQGPAATAQWLEELAEVYLGPKEDRADFIAKNNTRNGVSSNSPVADVYYFQQLISKAFESETLVVPSMDFVTNGNAVALFHDAEHRMESAGRTLVKNEPDALVSYLDSSQMLADLPELRTYPINENRTYLSIIVDSLKRHKNKSKVMSLLESRPPSLGCQLILAQLGSDADRVNCLDSLGDQLDSAGELEPSQKRELVLMLEAAGIDKVKEDNLSVSARSGLEWYQKAKNKSEANLAEKILAAKRYEELGIGNMQLEEWLISILPGVYARDPDLSVQLYFKVTDLYQEAMQRNVVNRYYSHSVASEVLPDMARRMLPPTLDKLHMAIRIIAAERNSGFSLSRSDIQASAIPVKAAWTKHSKGHPKDPAKAMEDFHNEMYEEFGDSPESRLLIAAHISVFDDMNDDDLAAVHEWLQAKVEEATADRLAADMLAACHLEIDSRHDHPHDYHTTGLGEARLAAQPYHEHYLAQLTDDSTPLHVRALVGMFLYDQQQDRLPAALARVIAANDTKAIRKNYEISLDHQRAMCANVLSLDGDSLWKETAEPFAAACKERFLRVHSSTQRNQFPRSLHDITTADVLSDLLSLYLTLEDDSSVNQLFHRYDNRISQQVDSLVLLILADKTEKAAGYARRFWNQLSLNETALNKIHFEPTLAEKMPEFLDEITSEDLRYFYETLFRSLSDPEPQPDGQSADRDSRLMAQAERFSQVPFNNKQLKARTLLLFSSSPTATDLLGNELSQEAAGIDLRAAAQRNDSHLADLQALFLQYVGYSLRAGDLDAVKQFVSQVCSKDSSNRYWQLESLSRESNKPIVLAMASRLNQWTPDQFEELFSIIKTFSEDEYNFQDRDYLNSMLVLTSIRAGHADQLPAWYKNLDSSARAQLKSAGVSEEIWDWTAKLCGEPTENNQPQRMAAVSALLQLADAFGWLQHGNTLQMGLKGTIPADEWPLDELFTEQELVELGPQLAEAAPAEGLTWVHVARKQQAAGQHLAAAESWLQARKLIKSNAMRFPIILNRAEALVDGGELKTARQELAVLTFAGLSGETKERYQALLARIKSLVKEESSGEKAEDDPKPKTDKVSSRLPMKKHFHDDTFRFDANAAFVIHSQSI